MSNLYRLDLYDTSGVRQYQLTDLLSLAYTRRVNAPGVVQFSVNGDHDLVANIADKWQVEVWRKPTGQVWAREITGLYRKGTWSNFGTSKFVVFCNGLLSMLAYAIVAWDAGTANKSQFTGAAAETIMKTLVRYNASTDATTGNGRNRTHTQSLYTGLSRETDAAGGNSVDWFCANENLLETLQKLALVAGGDFDIVKTSSTAWQFRFYSGQLGTDKSASVTFAMEYGNMAQPIYIEDRTGEATAAVVGGQGEGADRAYVIRTGTNFSAANDIEVFVNASSITSTNGLNAKGDEVLAKMEAVSSFTFEVLQSPQTLYGVDYTLGDLVSAVNPLTGTVYTRKVQSVTVTLDESGQEQVSVELAVP